MHVELIRYVDEFICIQDATGQEYESQDLHNPIR